VWSYVADRTVRRYFFAMCHVIDHCCPGIVKGKENEGTARTEHFAE
jgi:hypothetical protein